MIGDFLGYLLLAFVFGGGLFIFGLFLYLVFVVEY